MNARSMSGVTLLEVLVGFVIFMSSLVAILDYVANQVHLRKSAEQNLGRVMALYDRVHQPRELMERAEGSSPAAGRVEVEQQASDVIDSYRFRDRDVELRRSDYRAIDAGGEFRWSVIEIH